MRPNAAPSETSPPPMTMTTRPPTSAVGSVSEDAARRAASCRARPGAAGRCRPRRPPPGSRNADSGDASSSDGCDDLGVVVEREVHRAQAVGHVGPHGIDVRGRSRRRGRRRSARPLRGGGRPGWAGSRPAATSPRRTWEPSGASMRRSRMLSRLSRTSGTPRTMTWKTFCCSKKAPTSSPCTRVAAARRTSPGLTPCFAGRVEVDLDLQRRLHRRRQDVRVVHAADPGDRPRTAPRLAIEDAEVLSVHPDGEALVGGGRAPRASGRPRRSGRCCARPGSRR